MQSVCILPDGIGVVLDDPNSEDVTDVYRVVGRGLNLESRMHFISIYLAVFQCYRITVLIRIIGSAGLLAERTSTIFRR